MANHGWTKTRKQMKPEQITAMLDELNASLFKGNLQIEYHMSTPENPGWGPHTWVLRYHSEGQEWASRVCWLNTGKHFEMRHGGGSQLAWWIDTAILNEVAVRFDGTIGDDGVSQKWKGEPGKFNSFNDYLDQMWKHVKSPKVKAQLRNLENQFIPKEFQE
jgi:hypothetical protein